MTAKHNVLKEELLKLIFHKEAITGLADIPLSSPNMLWVALHTNDPGGDGFQNSFEATFVPYERVGVVRSALGWEVIGDTVKPANDIVFQECTSVPNNITFFSIGTSQTGPGKILFKGRLTPILPVIVGTTPAISSESSLVET